MKISATISNGFQRHDVLVTTNGNSKTINIHGKAEGFGSSVNGGEILCLSLATCFCNDLYREAPRRGMVIESVEVTVSAEFGGEGEAASQIVYSVNVTAPSCTKEQIDRLIEDVDRIAEIHNTLRRGIDVKLT